MTRVKECFAWLDKHHWYYLNLPHITHDQRPLSQIWHSEKVQHATSPDGVLCLQLMDHLLMLKENP